MNWVDMPVGTVLRYTDGEFLGLIVARDEFGWTSAGSDGRCVPSDFGDAWVELVEKPATPSSLQDSEGRDPICGQRGPAGSPCIMPPGHPVGDDHYSGLFTWPATSYPDGACPGCGAPSMGDCSAHLSDCPSYQALRAAEAADVPTEMRPARTDTDWIKMVEVDRG